MAFRIDPQVSPDPTSRQNSVGPSAAPKPSIAKHCQQLGQLVQSSSISPNASQSLMKGSPVFEKFLESLGVDQNQDPSGFQRLKHQLEKIAVAEGLTPTTLVKELENLREEVISTIKKDLKYPFFYHPNNCGSVKDYIDYKSKYPPNLVYPDLNKYFQGKHFNQVHNTQDEVIMPFFVEGTEVFGSDFSDLASSQIIEKNLAFSNDLMSLKLNVKGETSQLIRFGNRWGKADHELAGLASKFRAVKKAADQIYNDRQASKAKPQSEQTGTKRAPVVLQKTDHQPSSNQIRAQHQVKELHQIMNQKKVADEQYPAAVEAAFMAETPSAQAFRKSVSKIIFRSESLGPSEDLLYHHPLVQKLINIAGSYENAKPSKKYEFRHQYEELGKIAIDQRGGGIRAVEEWQFSEFESKVLKLIKDLNQANNDQARQLIRREFIKLTNGGMGQAFVWFVPGFGTGPTVFDFLPVTDGNVMDGYPEVAPGKDLYVKPNRVQSAPK